MAIGYGFGSLAQHTIAGLRDSLDQGAWGAIKTARFEDESEAPAHLLDAPRFVAWKLQLRWPLDRLITAIAGGATSDVEDTAWDRSERRFAAKVVVGENSDDPAVVAAAGRVRKAMLMGDGTGQTNLRHDAEVHFGRTQLRLAKEPQLAEDLVAIDATQAIDDVKKTTHDLAVALGMPDGEKRPLPPSDRVRLAMSEAVQALNDVMRSMQWHLDHLPEGDARAQVAALQATLALLLDQATPEPAPKTPTAPVG